MPRMTQADLNAYEARRRKPTCANPQDGCSDESELHAQILAECRRRGWMVIHSRMDKPTTNGVGSPDFVIYGTKGAREGTQYPEVFTIEAKSKNGKLSPAQHAMIAQAVRYGHAIHVVRSLEDFLKLL
jgi:hypothetical protein